MAIRTTVDAVKLLLGIDYDSTNCPSLTGYIDTASAIVDQMVECATRKGITISEELRGTIEGWLAAHAYGMVDQPYKSRSTLRAAGVFQGQTGMYLEATKYGQMAVLLDPSGCLNNIGKRNKVQGFWLGKRPSQQIDAVDRD